MDHRIDRVLVSRMSELTYTPAWWVPGGHLQTLWGKLVRRTPEVATRVERWPTPDDDEIELHRLDPPPGAGPRVPRLLILHGLEGTIRSHYVRGILVAARTYGWAADVLVFRGCGTEMNRAARMYHSGETTDLDDVVRRLARDNPEQPIVAVGFSLGGNVLLKWLGELGSSVPAQFLAAAAVSVPYDLERGSRHLEHGLSRIYARSFLRSLRKKAAIKHSQYPNLFDMSRLALAGTLFDFDDAVTAPMHGFASAHDYYHRSSSIHFLGRIARPTLLLSAYNDPFLPREVLDDVAKLSRSNHHLTVEFQDNGGHVGFVEGRVPLLARYFAEQRSMDFLSRQVALQKNGRPRFSVTARQRPQIPDRAGHRD